MLDSKKRPAHSSVDLSDTSLNLLPPGACFQIGVKAPKPKGTKGLKTFKTAPSTFNSQVIFGNPIRRVEKELDMTDLLQSLPAAAPRPTKATRPDESEEDELDQAPSF